MSARFASLILLGALLSSAPVFGQEASPKKAPLKPAPAPAPVESGKDLLLRAYQKEYAFLANEESALQERLAEAERERAERSEAVQAEIAALEEQVRLRRKEIEEGREALTGLEETASNLEDGSDAVETVLAQAGATRERYGRAKLDEGLAPAAQVEASLDDVLVLLGDLSRVRREEGTFFLADGKQTEGTLVRVGGIGALGVSPAGAGVLAPAGEGRLQLWSAESADAARSSAKGELPGTLPLYIFESLDKPAEVQKEKTFADVVDKAGVIGYVIVALGLLAILLLAVRTALLQRAAGAPDALLDEVRPLIAAGRLQEAASRCAGTSSAQRVLAGTVAVLDRGAEKLESAANERILLETQRVERFGAAIVVIAAVAPLLGLLGTVTGMIATFDVITVYGTGDPKLLSGGISEALITTQLGLAVAIPTLLLGNLLGGWAEQIRSGMERAALQVALLAEGQAEPQAEDEPEAESADEENPAEAPAPAEEARDLALVGEGER